MEIRQQIRCQVSVIMVWAAASARQSGQNGQARTRALITWPTGRPTVAASPTTRAAGRLASSGPGDPAGALRQGRRAGLRCQAWYLGWEDRTVEILSSRILLRPADLSRSRRFYRDVLGLAVYREFGSPADPGVVFFLGPGLLEVAGSADGPPGNSVLIWLQVRDVHAAHERLAAAGARVLR